MKRIAGRGAERTKADFWDKRAGRYEDAVRRHDAEYRRSLAGAKALLSAADVVLDLGCASGEYSLDIAPFVKRVHGIDTSANMIALAGRKAGERAVGNAVFGATDVFDRSLDAMGFTAVLAFNVLHLVEDPRAVLARVGELLPAGGLLVSQTPCLGESGFLFRLVLKLALKAKVVPPFHGLAPLELEATIAAAGFDIAASEAWERRKALRWIVARKR